MQVNGSELLITPASFAEAMALQKAIGRALKGNKLDLPESVTADMKPEMLTGIIDAVLGVACSDEVETCLFECAKRSVYGPAKEPVTRDFFEKPENRAAYYPIMIEIIKANCGPFFKDLGIQLSGLGLLAGSLRK